jgi:hypothetical protein
MFNTFRVTRGNVHDTSKFGPRKRISKKYHIDKVDTDKAHDNRNKSSWISLMLNHLLEALSEELLLIKGN